MSIKTAAASASGTGTKRRMDADKLIRASFLLPGVLVILALAIFPLLLSIYFSLSRFQLVSGGFKLTFIGWLNYRKLFIGSEQEHFLGRLTTPGIVGWLAIIATAALLTYGIVRSVRGGTTFGGLFWRIIGALGTLGLVYLAAATISAGGRPGTLVVTLFYVVTGVTIQYLLGLGLALLCVQNLPGRRFFRVVFLLPMMITPVGIAYMFRMLTDTAKGPLVPFWNAAGLQNYSWTTDPWGARFAVVIGDVWQWTPFMFIVLVAALEAQPTEPIEAALVDGASPWAIFRYITLPAILPVSTTLILIRMIESFKIIDLPRVLTNGGPGTATESLTLHSVLAWRALDLGLSAAVAFVLLILVTFVATAFVSLVRSRTTTAV